ncbi:hypothetical protein N825_08285 [Skermanella stibiiresistens SB22]|uniref:Uncharacterized protein n=1 Tax=Skermanella stibiiresistens SB22 TaxID=1385369 RepID=W9GYT3_9PROT|nr:hypothetical protein [Skermanella stibiiresistens]EWY38989.1 hypothetical protein N825_08285 [Skermanella stibiiresistens SB22]
MRSVNINQRDSIESCYSRDNFIHDAGVNARARESVMHGVRILSAPDGDGAFKLIKAQHSIAEDAHDQDALFLYAVRDDDNTWFDKSEPDAQKAVHAKANPVDLDKLYSDFIDRVIATAKGAHFQDAIGKGESRLKGFHGG